MINHLGLTARQLANEWEAHALSRGADDASQALLTLSSLGALEAVLNKRSSAAAASTPAASLAKVRAWIACIGVTRTGQAPTPPHTQHPSNAFPTHSNPTQHSVGGRTRR